MITNRNLKKRAIVMKKKEIASQADLEGGWYEFEADIFV